ncbi:MAG TPA: hypothetical protein VHA70_03170 [Bauldia sp.]|nr:hypothetical protein [Bauldia sp.]
MPKTALIAAATAVLLIGGATTQAAPASLDGTGWIADDCDFDIIEFNAHGAAVAVDTDDQGEDDYGDGKWTIQGAQVHFSIPDWNEKFDGTLENDNELSGAVTAHDEKGRVIHLTCHFAKM